MSQRYGPTRGEPCWPDCSRQFEHDHELPTAIGQALLEPVSRMRHLLGLVPIMGTDPLLSTRCMPDWRSGGVYTSAFRLNSLSRPSATFFDYLSRASDLIQVGASVAIVARKVLGWVSVEGATPVTQHP